MKNNLKQFKKKSSGLVTADGKPIRPKLYRIAPERFLYSRRDLNNLLNDLAIIIGLLPLRFDEESAIRSGISHLLVDDITGQALLQQNEPEIYLKRNVKEEEKPDEPA